MEAIKLQLKLFARGAEHPHLEAFVPVLHGFIREHKLSQDVLLDVVDYSHVHRGPGVVLIGHGSDYYVDQGEGRLGLLYSRKRGGSSELGEAIVDGFRRALAAASLLEGDGALQPRLQFGTDEVLLRINDRLSASNTPEQLAELRPALERALGAIYGERFELLQEGSPRELFTVRIKAAGAPDVAGLVQRLGTAN